MESDQFINLGIGGLGIDKLQGILRVDMKIKCYNFAHITQIVDLKFVADLQMLYHRNL